MVLNEMVSSDQVERFQTTPSLPKGAPKIQLSDNAYQVFKRRYMRRDAQGKLVETVEETFWRVAYHVAAVEEKWGQDSFETARRFYNLLAEKRFLPNSPTFTGAGTPLGQLAACFVCRLATIWAAGMTAFSRRCAMPHSSSRRAEVMVFPSRVYVLKAR